MIGLEPHSLITTNKTVDVTTDARGYVHFKDNPGLIKLAVVERHKATGHVDVALLDPAYGLKHRAIATSMSHDSHNIVVAVERVTALQGGIVMVAEGEGEVIDELALPVAGL